jgi:protein-L-isoaspartate(D-aspartate) O-methyltransferase
MIHRPSGALLLHRRTAMMSQRSSTDGSTSTSASTSTSGPGAANGDGVEDPQARPLREALVREFVARGDITVPSVIEALRLVPRHLFAPKVPIARAYQNRPILIEAEQTVSQPSIVARMTEALELRGHERVLEIGTGSGYQTALLATLAREVYSIERIELLSTKAAERLARLGYANVQLRMGDGFAGWADEAPFDRIIVTAAPRDTPVALLEQLSLNGILIAPIGPAAHARLERYRSVVDAYVREDLGAVAFVEMRPGIEREGNLD